MVSGEPSIRAVNTGCVVDMEPSFNSHERDRVPKFDIRTPSKQTVVIGHCADTIPGLWDMSVTKVILVCFLL
jgi:hypothetical protein